MKDQAQNNDCPENSLKFGSFIEYHHNSAKSACCESFQTAAGVYVLYYLQFLVIEVEIDSGILIKIIT